MTIIKCEICEEVIQIKKPCHTCKSLEYFPTPEGRDERVECNGSGKLIQIFECKCERNKKDEVAN